MKSKILYISVILMLVVVLFTLTGCSKEEVEVTSTASGETESAHVHDENCDHETEETEKSSTRVVDTIDYETAAKKQMAAPEKGETVAIIKVKNYGEIKVKFFKDVAPKAVENFITHAKEGYYDGVVFHRVIEEFMIQGGDPLGNGTGGESIWGKGFEEELDFELVPYRGALSMASQGKGKSSLGSQFYIVQGNYNESDVDYLKSLNFPEGLIEQYKIYGGYPSSLYLNYTIFGQVYEGMDVVDKIAKVETDSNDKPIKDVVIESIKVIE